MRAFNNSKEKKYIFAEVLSTQNNRVRKPQIAKNIWAANCHITEGPQICGFVIAKLICGLLTFE
jgi:hypothetical protein